MNPSRFLRTVGFAFGAAAIGAAMPALSSARGPGPGPTPPAHPNVVLIVLDDVGFADLGAYGSEIATPNIDSLARDGLKYVRFDSKAICSATRASLLTGRNNQTVRMEDLASGKAVPDPTDLSASKGELPRNVETVAEALHRVGYSTTAIGKWHLAPEYDALQGKLSWPLQRGFDRFYGFLSGWTDQYRPKLVADNASIPTPTTPGYHFSVDITDHAIAALDRQTQSPQFLYLAYGAAHSPLQVPKSYIDRYAARYDIGWDALRAQRFARQKKLGIIPAHTVLPPRGAGDRAWSSLGDQEKRVFSRFMATYAGFVTHTDEQIGRLIDHLKRSGQYENTLFVLISDNGAASEGGQRGAFFKHYGDTTTVDEMAAHLDEIGGPTTLPLYQRPWAMAGVTPYRRYKLWPFAGGVRTPMIVAWPGRIGEVGGIRRQFVDAIDIAPTIVDIAHAPFSQSISGIRQIPVAGRSIRSTFASSTARVRDVQFFELRGNRAVTVGKWRAVAMHRLDTDFAIDDWMLFDTQKDPAETTDLAATYPEKIKQLKQIWWNEARRYSNPPVTKPNAALYRFNHIDDAFADESRPE